MLEETLIFSPTLGRNRAIWLDEPDGLDPDRLCVILDAENYLCNVGLGAILTRVQRDGFIGRSVLVFVPFVTPENRHTEYACDSAFEGFLVDDLVGWAHTRYPTLQAGRHGLVGLSLSGLQAVWTALRNPGVFSGVISQSPSAWYHDECLRREINPGVEPKSAFRISVGSRETSSGVIHEPGSLHQKTSQVDSCGRLVEGLKAAGHEVEYSVFEGDHDSIYWAEEMSDALRWLDRT